MHPLWHAVFGNHNAVEIEIGPGTGTFIIPAAVRRSDVNFFGIERSPSRASALAAIVANSGLANVRVIAADAACVVTTIIPTASVSAFHAYFPDPWWKRRHQRRRVFTPHFAEALARALVPTGRLHVATDVDELFAHILRTLECAPDLEYDPNGRSPRPRLTVFERKGLARGALIQEAAFVKTLDAPRRTIAHVSNAAPITPAESPS